MIDFIKNIEKEPNKKIKKFCLIMFILLTTLTGVSNINGTINTECITAEITDISPSSVKVGDEFTVGIVIENCGSEIPEDIVFELENISPFIGVKESLIREIGTLRYSNSDRFITYHMKVSENAIPGTYSFNYKLYYGSQKSQTQSKESFEITVLGDTADLGIASMKVEPLLPSQGDNVEITMRIENVGKGVAKSISVYTNHSFMGLKKTFIGTLDPNEDGPSVINFIANQSGEYEFPVIINYRDDFGEKQLNTSINFIVLEKKKNIGETIIILLVIIIIGGLLYYNYKIKKTKDRVIKQLMKGNNSFAKKK